MARNVHIHLHSPDPRIDQILDLLHQVITKENLMAGELAQLQADVAAEQGVVQSAITLLQGLKAALDAAGTDPAALAALSADLEASTTALSDAVAANPLP